jgi:hypothetical protein
MSTSPYSAPSKTTRFLWWCAGADEHFLMKSPMQDRVKYAGIGGIVLCTGALAMVSGGFAFFTAFGPKAYAMDQQEAAGIGFLIGTVLFGITWGLVIFNLDRFIVSSTGKGDGTDTVTLREVAQAAPRIIIALILGFAISAPLEIRILKSEIDNELDKFQKTYTQERNMQSDSLFAQRKAILEKDKAELEGKLASYETELKVYDDKIDELVEKKRLEMQDKRAYGEGPVAKALQKNIDDKMAEKEKFAALKSTDMNAWKTELEQTSNDIRTLDDELRAEYKKNEESAHTYSGLLKRIQISHEVGGVIPWIIFLVILCIEMGPIFFKMMLTKGPYDYMVENQNYLLNVENGVLKEDHIYQGTDGIIHMEKYRYLEVEKAKKDKEAKLEALGRINQHIIGSWEQIKMKQVSDNPQAHYKEDQSQTGKA